MNKFLLLLFALTFMSCKQFETRRISSEQILREESEELNWHQVDQYPAFEECREFLLEEEAKACFGQKVAQYVYGRLENKHPVVTKSLNDTIMLHLVISSQGIPTIDSIEIDSIITQQLPKIRTWIRQSVDSLPEIDPATKRGMPVASKFKMPVVIQTD